MKFFRTVLIFILLISSGCAPALPAINARPTAVTVRPSPLPSPSPSPRPALSAADESYLKDTLDIIQKNALNSNKVNWTTLRPQLLEQAQGMKTRKDLYGIIRAALFELQDNHSHFLSPEEMASLQNGPPAENTKPQFELVAGKYGEVIMPGFNSINEDQARQYADEMQQKIRELDQKNPCGWIIDLSNNTGGNMWPMLAGLDPFLGNGDFGYFVTPDGGKHPWSVQNGKGLDDNEMQIQISGKPYILAHPDAPVAVLLGSQTASSGENMALSFIGRPNTRSFGSRTYGLTTANALFPLSDGAAIFLTTAVDADRTGKVYGQEITPDVETQGTGIPQEAYQWLADQPACK